MKKRHYYKDDEWLKQIGNRIRDARTERGISIELLANECGVDYSQINRMELGKVNFGVSYLNKIAAALEIDPKELLPE